MVVPWMPETGETDVMAGSTGAKYVNPRARRVVWPSVFVATTSTVPTACGPVEAVIVVEFTTSMFEVDTPPRVTDVPISKLVPMIVIGVPPDAGPELGEIDEIVGAGAVGGTST